MYIPYLGELNVEEIDTSNVLWYDGGWEEKKRNGSWILGETREGYELRSPERMEGDKYCDLGI